LTHRAVYNVVAGCRLANTIWVLLDVGESGTTFTYFSNNFLVSDAYESWYSKQQLRSLRHIEFLISIGTVNGTSQEVHSFAPPLAKLPGLQGIGWTVFSGQKNPRGQKPLQFSLYKPDVSPYFPSAHLNLSPSLQK
jgi:hypothetical protein